VKAIAGWLMVILATAVLATCQAFTGGGWYW
jgi:hypothetical protein